MKSGDPSANLTAGLGFSLRQVKKSAADILLGNERLNALYQSVGLTDLDIIPSGPDMAAAAKMIAVRSQHETILRRSLHGNAIARF